MRVGVLGAGQLGRMLALAGVPLGIEFRFLDPTPNSPAGAIAEQFVGGYTHAKLIERFVADLDLVTYEFENVPIEATSALSAKVPILPNPVALETAQDRLIEKSTFAALKIPTPAFAAVDDAAGLSAGLDVVGLPAVLKTRRLGYDGKGQCVVHTRHSAEEARVALGGADLILEEFVKFQRELSLICVRAATGQTAHYPLVENHHEGGILRRSVCPAPRLSTETERTAQLYGEQLLNHLGYVGVLTLELFDAGNRILANEMAPRVHNSGHGTIEGCATSQFENHLRAICGLPLGSTHVRSAWTMVNLIETIPDPAQVLAVRGAHLHLYGKSPRPGRKLGHITYLESDGAELSTV